MATRNGTAPERAPCRSSSRRSEAPDISRVELARAMRTKPLTVKIHLENIRARMGAQGNSQQQLAQWLIDLDPTLAAPPDQSERT